MWGKKSYWEHGLGTDSSDGVSYSVIAWSPCGIRSALLLSGPWCLRATLPSAEKRVVLCRSPGAEKQLSGCSSLWQSPRESLPLGDVAATCHLRPPSTWKTANPK